MLSHSLHDGSSLKGCLGPGYIQPRSYHSVGQPSTAIYRRRGGLHSLYGSHPFCPTEIHPRGCNSQTFFREKLRKIGTIANIAKENATHPLGKAPTEVDITLLAGFYLSIASAVETVVVGLPVGPDTSVESHVLEAVRLVTYLINTKL